MGRVNRGGGGGYSIFKYGNFLNYHCFFEFYHRENTDFFFFLVLPKMFPEKYLSMISLCVMKLILLCVRMHVFPDQHSPPSLPDSVTMFWRLNSFAWSESGQPFTAWHLSPFLIQLSPVPHKECGPVTPDQLHPFNLPGVFKLLSFAQHALLKVLERPFPFPRGTLCLSL